MSTIEFIGFFISLIAFIILGYKRMKDDQRRQKDPIAYEHEEYEKQKRLKQFLRSLELDMEEDEEEIELPPAPPPPPPKPKPLPKIASPSPPLPKPASTMDDFTFKTKLENHKQQSVIEKRAFKSSLDERYKYTTLAPEYEVQKKHIPSYAERALKAAPSFQHMIIYQAILGPPRGLSPWK